MPFQTKNRWRRRNTDKHPSLKPTVLRRHVCPFSLPPLSLPHATRPFHLSYRRDPRLRPRRSLRSNLCLGSPQTITPHRHRLRPLPSLPRRKTRRRTPTSRHWHCRNIRKNQDRNRGQRRRYRPRDRRQRIRHQTRFRHLTALWNTRQRRRAQRRLSLEHG